MKTVTEHIRARLLHNVVLQRVPDLDELRRTERDLQFELLRSNRLIIGALRYGLLRAKGKPQYDRVKSMTSRLGKYKQDRNAEHLVDVANLAMLEFVEGDHLGVTAKDDGEHVQVK